MGGTYKNDSELLIAIQEKGCSQISFEYSSSSLCYVTAEAKFYIEIMDKLRYVFTKLHSLNCLPSSAQA
jgi:hypothetical protein